MTWVKVCGLKSTQEIDAAAAAGADAIGLVLAPSPREISIERARDLAGYVATAHPGLLSFAVTSDLAPQHLRDIVQNVGVSGVQPHGLHSQAAANAVRVDRPDLVVLQPVGVDPVHGRGDWSSIPTDHLPLFDTKVAGVEGGSGIPFDWALVADVSRDFVLAGGLSPDNVVRAVVVSGAWGVDASSGLESSLGIKDLIRIRDFVRGAKS